MSARGLSCATDLADYVSSDLCGKVPTEPAGYARICHGGLAAFLFLLLLLLKYIFLPGFRFLLAVVLTDFAKKSSGR